jgi:hypothetical protein
MSSQQQKNTSGQRQQMIAEAAGLSSGARVQRLDAKAKH